MKFDAQFAWEHIEDDPLAYGRHDAWTGTTAPSRTSAARRRVYRLAFLVSALLVLAGTFYFWHEAKAQQHDAARDLAAALDAVVAPAGSHAPSRFLPAATQVNRRGDLAYVRVDAHALQQGHGDIVLHKTAQGWQRLAPADGAWGAQQELSTGAFTVTYWAKDAEIVHAAAVQADVRITYIRRMLGLGESAPQLNFLVAPDAWGMPAGSDNQWQIVLPDSLDGDAARIAYLTEALLRPQVAAAVHELAGPAAATTTQQRILTAVEDWLLANAFPYLADDPTVGTSASGKLSSTKAIDVPYAAWRLSSEGASTDLTPLLAELVATRGYVALGELSRAIR